jgi:soluble lytic murein transglycosylase-like protein
MPFGPIIRSAARRYSVDELLVAAIVEAESSFNPMAISPVGAIGLMQVMPATAATFGAADPSNPAVNIDLGARYLSRLLNRFGGDLELALAAYNAGPGAVDRYDGMPPYRETRAYVGRVLSRYVDHHQRAWRDSRAEDWLLY